MLFKKDAFMPAIDTPLKVLVVDDSRTFRTILEAILRKMDGVTVIGAAEDGEKAIEFLKTHEVDLMTLDVEMPNMNGLETLRKMKLHHAALKNMPGVLMVSSLTRTGADITMQALELGAFDFVAKPGEGVSNAQESLTRMLNLKLHTWLHRKASGAAPAARPAGNFSAAAADANFTFTLAKPGLHARAVQAIVLGVSTGGPRSLGEMLPSLCKVSDLPILLVQHMPPQFTQSLANSLQPKCQPYTVVEGKPGMVVEPKHVYIAPGGFHMTVHNKGGHMELATNQDPPENGCRPSVDVLFRSAAAAYPSDTLVGIILTGMGNDGTPSLPSLKKQNAYLIAQDEKTSVVYGMPKAAAATGLLDAVAPLMEVPQAVQKRLMLGTGK
jgi:two-component system chemotaxis response regulator CheB